MCVRLLAFACLLCALNVSMAWGQVVQLPTFNYFSVQTSVLAPDRGGAFLGGVRRSSSRNAAYGVPGAGRLPGVGRLFGNRVLDGTAGGRSSSVHVTIIDHEELDQAVLAAAARERSAPSRLDQRAAALAQRMGTSESGGNSTGDTLVSVAELRRQHEARQATGTNEAARLFDQGRQAEARGQASTARIYYRMAQKRAGGELQRQITARLTALEQRGS